jgi:putative transposase
VPSRNSLKIYADHGLYHIYNRGVEKRFIFEGDQDYKVFLRYLKEVLSPIDKKNLKTTFNLRGQSYKAEKRPLKNYSTEIDLAAYCLMPNHFHFLIKQNDKVSIEGFMRALMTRYSMYFNKKYERVGPLFQGRYKAVLVNDESYLLHLSRYIHLNPGEYSDNLEGAYSSYADYLGIRATPWVKPNVILSFFNQANLLDFENTGTYKNFVEKYKDDGSKLLGDLKLE